MFTLVSPQLYSILLIFLVIVILWSVDLRLGATLRTAFLKTERYLFIHRSKEIAEELNKKDPLALPDKSSLTQVFPPADPSQTLYLLQPQKEDSVFWKPGGESTFCSRTMGPSTFDKHCLWKVEMEQCIPSSRHRALPAVPALSTSH